MRVIFYQSDHANQASSLNSSSRHATCTASSLSFNTTRNDVARTQPDQSTLITTVYTRSLEQNSSPNHSVPGIDNRSVIVSSDIWSAAYREAVESLGKDIDAAILQGDNVAQLFRQLEDIDKEATQESVFLRGVRYLHSIQVPLETFKLALDLASPLTSAEPTSAMVFGVVRSVTAVSSFHKNFTSRNFWEISHSRSTDSYQHRLLSALQLLILSSRRKLGKCLSRFPTLMIVTRSVRKQTK